MIKNVLIAPSTDPCEIKGLTKYAIQIEKSGADWLHCDIMDGKFVKRRTYDYMILAFIRKSTKLFLDVHLMVKNPIQDIKNYAKYGADLITIHYEAFRDKLEFLKAVEEVKKFGVKVGVAIKPSTAVNVLDNILGYVDLVLIMSAEPGKSGQQFIQNSLVKIAYLNKKRTAENLNFMIEVDGGINTTNASIVAVSGADVLVSGSAVFSSTNKKRTINELRGQFESDKK